MRRGGVPAQLGLFPVREVAHREPDSYDGALRRLRELLSDGEWHAQREVLAAAGDWQHFYSVTRWGGLGGEGWRLPVRVRLAAPGEPVYALWEVQGAARV